MVVVAAVVDVFEGSRFVDDFVDGFVDEFVDEFVDDGFVDGGFADGGRAGDDVLGGSDATTGFWASVSLPFLLGGLGRARFREVIAKTSCPFPP